MTKKAEFPLGEPMVRLTIRIPESLRNEIEDMAHDGKQTVSGMAWMLLERGLRMPPPAPDDPAFDLWHNLAIKPAEGTA